MSDIDYGCTLTKFTHPLKDENRVMLYAGNVFISWTSSCTAMLTLLLCWLR